MIWRTEALSRLRSPFMTKAWPELPVKLGVPAIESVVSGGLKAKRRRIELTAVSRWRIPRRGPFNVRTGGAPIIGTTGAGLALEGRGA
jgi:hypothetical protein